MCPAKPQWIFGLFPDGWCLWVLRLPQEDLAILKMPHWRLLIHISRCGYIQKTNLSANAGVVAFRQIPLYSTCVLDSAASHLLVALEQMKRSRIKAWKWQRWICQNFATTPALCMVKKQTIIWETTQKNKISYIIFKTIGNNEFNNFIRFLNKQLLLLIRNFGYIIFNIESDLREQY